MRSAIGARRSLFSGQDDSIGPRSIGGAAPVVLPTTGLVGRYEANSAGNFSLTGSLIDQWSDTSGAGNHLTSAGALRPTLDTALGYNRVLFGGAHEFTLPATVSLNRQACSIYVVQRAALGGTAVAMVSLGTTPDLGLYGNTRQIAIRHSGAILTGTYSAGQTGINTLWMIGDAANAFAGHARQTYTRGSALTAGTFTGTYVGRWGATAFYFSGEMLAVLIYNTAHSQATREQVLDYCAQTYKSLPRTGAPSTAIYCQGDSLTEGQQSTSFMDYSWPSQLSRQHSYHPYIQNGGSGGRQLFNVTSAAAEIAWLPQVSSFTNRVIYVLLGTNDIASNAKTAADIQGYYATYTANIRAADAGVKIIGATLLARGAYNAEFAAFNSWLRGGGGGLFDGFVDYNAQPEFDPGSHVDTTYYDPDGIHCNNTGYGRMAVYARADMIARGYI